MQESFSRHAFQKASAEDCAGIGRLPLCRPRPNQLQSGQQQDAFQSSQAKMPWKANAIRPTDKPQGASQQRGETSSTGAAEIQPSFKTSSTSVAASGRGRHQPWSRYQPSSLQQAITMQRSVGYQRSERLERLRAEEEALLEKVRQRRIKTAQKCDSAASIISEAKQADCQIAATDKTLKDFCICPITMQVMKDPVVAKVSACLTGDASFWVG